MMTLFLLFLIQFLSGFLVLLGVEYLRNPKESILRYCFKGSKLYIIEFRKKVLNTLSPQKDAWVKFGILVFYYGIALLILSPLIHIAWRVLTWIEFIFYVVIPTIFLIIVAIYIFLHKKAPIPTVEYRKDEGWL